MNHKKNISVGGVPPSSVATTRYQNLRSTFQAPCPWVGRVYIFPPLGHTHPLDIPPIPEGTWNQAYSSPKGIWDQAYPPAHPLDIPTPRRDLGPGIPPEQTDTRGNMTFPQLPLRAVKIETENIMFSDLQKSNLWTQNLPFPVSCSETLELSCT